MPSPVIATASTAVEEPIEPAEAVEAPQLGAIEVEQPETGTIEPAPEAAVEPAAELVPEDVSLDEYVQNFRYEPPAEPTEITMRGDASVAEQQAAAEAVVAESIPAEESQPDVVLASAPTDGEAAVAGDEASDSSVESRLGLDPNSPAEVAAERPRFLDLGEPAAESAPASSGTSTIVGPSFLGLSDAPQVEADDRASEDFDEAAPPKSHWRAWLAAAVVIVIAALGIIEWRSQSHQTDNGPVEIMKAKVRNLENGGQSPAADQTVADNGGKPDMQVQEQPKPQQPTQAANQPQSSNAPAGNAAASQTAVTTVRPPAVTTPPPNSNQSASVAPQKPSAAITVAAKTEANSAAVPSKTQATTQAETAKPTAVRQDQGSSDETAASKSGAGADELNKAKNASDSAAEAAWLWKSTAKGNADAPVMLADMYMKGDGVPRSCEQAVVLLKTAAEKENARARNRLASMYATGNCVQRNRVEAYRWLSSALVANPHSDWAQQNKNLIWQQMTPQEQAEAQKYR